MQQWTLDRTSESPESSGRPSLHHRDSKVFKSENRYGRRSGRVEVQSRLSGGGSRGRESLSATGSQHRHNEEEGEENEGRSSVPQRLSRHIPQRTGIDMAVSSFNLVSSLTCPPQATMGSPRGFTALHTRSHHGGSLAGGRSATPSTGAGATAAGSTSAGGGGAASVSGALTATTATTTTSATVPLTPSSSALTSFSESMISDDSSYMTSLYNDVLADNLIGHPHTATAAGVNAADALTHGITYSRGTATAPGVNGSGLPFHNSTAEERGRGSETSSEERGSGRRTHADGTALSSRRGLGGEVLRFANTTTPSELTPRSFGAATPTEAAAASLRFTTYTTKGARGQATASTTLPRVRSRTFYTSGSGGRGGGSGTSSGARVFNTTPERVLDAPQFPSNATQLLDWGANNSIVIGMGQSLYAWSGDSGQASKVVDLDGVARIRCVQWVHRCTCVALSVQDGTTAIYDCRTSDFLRTLRLPSGLEVAGLSTKGPIMAIASTGPHGTTCAYDLRAKDALVATYEGHNGGVASLHYCVADPFYLATGGLDGSVRVWDARRASTPRYAFDGVHQGSVNAIRWDPQKRSRLFTGGEDGVLCLMDTHAPKRTMELDTVADEEGAGVSGCSQEHLTQYITRAVNTQYPISGLACHGGSGEVVTAHKTKGQLQLRKTSTFHLLSTFNALHCDASLSCLTMAPDKESVCAAQGDETLKFWRVFDNSVARSGDRGVAAAPRPEWGTATADPNAYADEALR